MGADFSLDLPASDIHVWTLPLGVSDGVPAMFEQVLNQDETDRAARFCSTTLRDSFVIAHGALRYLLGRYLSLHPADIRFIYGPKGKPALASAGPLQFNMAHSGDLAVIAFTVDCEIGVDVEHIRPLADMRHIADRFFCREEAAEIESLPEPGRTRAFFRCWTRKEAYIKAIGAGLSAPLDSFRVSVQPGAPAALVHLDHDAIAAAAWTLQDLPLASEYAAAIAYRDRPRALRVFPIIHLAGLAYVG